MEAKDQSQKRLDSAHKSLHPDGHRSIFEARSNDVNLYFEAGYDHYSERGILGVILKCCKKETHPSDSRIIPQPAGKKPFFRDHPDLSSFRELERTTIVRAFVPRSLIQQAAFLARSRINRPDGGQVIGGIPTYFIKTASHQFAWSRMSPRGPYSTINEIRLLPCTEIGAIETAGLFPVNG